MKSRGKATLRRRAASRDPIVVFHVFCEGANTENDYLRAVIRTFGSTKFRMKFHGPNGVPGSVAKQAIKYSEKNGLGKRSRKKLNSFEKNDVVWAVFDRDEHPCYFDAIAKCKGYGLPYAYSDPCFELWLALHCGKHDGPCSRHDIQSKVKHLLPGYDPLPVQTHQQ